MDGRQRAGHGEEDLDSGLPAGAGGRSLKFTGGRKTWSMVVGRAWRIPFMAFDGDPVVGMMHVTW
jgi:hypothetical protein